MMKYAIQLDENCFIHYNINKNTTFTNDLEKAKMWEKLGMLNTFTEKSYYKKFLDNFPNWKIIEVNIEYKIKEYEI